MLGGLEKKNALVMEVLEHGGLIVAGGEEQLSLDRLHLHQAVSPCDSHGIPQFTQRMIAPLAKFIDWSVLQLAGAVVGLRHAPRPKWKLEEALEFLNGPDFIPAASDPARMEFDGPRHFTFPTPRPCEDEENNIVYGRLYRCAERWQERPAIILLDGAFSVGYHTAFPWLARRINRAGFNVATWVAPYDLQRRPRRPIKENCLEFARVMAQNVAEIRALIGWLLDEGCPSVGLRGFFAGGMDCGIDCVQRRTHRLCRFDCARRAHDALPSAGRVATASGSVPGSEAGTRSYGYNPVKFDFIHASHPERKYFVD